MMLSQQKLEKLFDFLDIPTNGRSMVLNARKNAPVRKVISTGKNIITDYKSRKMNKSILTESRSNEFKAMIQYEYSDRVLEFYPQPFAVDLFRTDCGKINRCRSQLYPDFLIIMDDSIAVDEWRTESKLIKLAAKYPGRYIRETDGWHDPEVEAHFQKMGLLYRLRSILEHPQRFIKNIEFLSDYYDNSQEPLPKHKIAYFNEAFKDNSFYKIGKFISLINGRFNDTHSDNTSENSSLRSISFDDVFKAIADREICFDLYEGSFSEPREAHIFRDKTAMLLHRRMSALPNELPVNSNSFSLNTGGKLEYDGQLYEISLVGNNSVLLNSDTGNTEIPIEVITTQFAQGKVKIHNVKNGTKEET
jgi:putative transposase